LFALNECIEKTGEEYSKDSQPVFLMSNKNEDRFAGPLQDDTITESIDNQSGGDALEKPGASTKPTEVQTESEYPHVEGPRYRRGRGRSFFKDQKRGAVCQGMLLKFDSSHYESFLLSILLTRDLPHLQFLVAMLHCTK